MTPAPKAAPPRVAMQSLPFARWPAQDQQAWESMFADGDIFDGRGPALAWRPATRKTNRYHYARWLGFLSEIGQLDECEAPAKRIVPAMISAYIERLRPGLSPVTVHCAIIGLRTVAGAMAPGEDWSWLSRVRNRLKAQAKPQKDKRQRTLSHERIYRAAMRDLSRLLKVASPTRRQLLAFRDNLAVAFLAAIPLRLKNFVGLRLGVHLTRDGESWTVQVPSEEVKNGAYLNYVLPDSLTPFLDHYVAQTRSLIGSGKDELWLATRRGPLSPEACYQLVLKTTKQLVGVAINPHAFRDCVATSIASRSPKDALTAASMLGHRSFATTEIHYVRARQVEAGRRVNAVFATIKAKARKSERR